MSCRATLWRMIALLSSIMSQSLRASSGPTQSRTFSIPQAKSVPIWPPLRPEAPQPTRFASKTTTS